MNTLIIGFMAKTIKKEKAQKLRKQGKSISEITKSLNISKSTASVWCRDISLTQQQINRLVKKQKEKSYKGRLKAAEIIRNKRIKETEELKNKGIKEINKLSKRDFFIAGIAMYWSEGYNSNSNSETGFVNSDPKMILFMIEWFKKCCNIKPNRFSLRVDINKIHKNRIKKVERYWSRLTNIPLSQFYKPSLKKAKTKKIYQNKNNYYGTLRIKIRKGTKLRRLIEGWKEGLKKDYY